MRAKLLTITTLLALTSLAPAQNTTGGGGGGGSTLGGSNSIGGSGGSGSSSQSAMQQSALNGFVDTSFGARNSNSAIASSNPFAAYYANPYAAGVTFGSSGPSFGTAVYNTSRGGAGGTSSGSRSTGASGFGNSTSGIGGASRSGSSGLGSTTSGFGISSSPSGGFGSSGSTGGGGNTGLNRGTTGTGFGSTGLGGGTAGFGIGGGGITQAFSPAAPSGLKTGILYPTVMRFDVNLPAATEVQTNLQSIVARSSSVRTPAGVRVDIDSGVVVLRGTVANDDERRHVENLVRLSPGVRDVRNELAVR